MLRGRPGHLQFLLPLSFPLSLSPSLKDSEVLTDALSLACLSACPSACLGASESSRRSGTCNSDSSTPCCRALSTRVTQSSAGRAGPPAGRHPGSANTTRVQVMNHCPPPQPSSARIFERDFGRVSKKKAPARRAALARRRIPPLRAAKPLSVLRTSSSRGHRRGNRVTATFAVIDAPSG